MAIFNLRSWLAASIILSTPVAANWTLPDDAINNQGAFANCTFSNDVVDCPGWINLNEANRELRITQPMTLLMRNSLQMPAGLTVNRANTQPFTLDMRASLSSYSNNLTFNGRIVSNSEVTFGNGAQINGAIETTGNVTLNPATVTGDISGQNVTFNGAAYVQQSVSATGTINLNNGSIEGNASAGGDININNGSTIGGDAQSGGVISLNDGSIGGSAEATGNININNGSSVGGDATSGQNIALNEGSVGGDAEAQEININNGSSIGGNARVQNQLTLNNGSVAGNISSQNRVTIESSGTAGSVNANGTVVNRGTVDGYINAPRVIGSGAVGESCDLNNNQGPCSATVPEDLTTAWCADIWPQGLNQQHFHPQDIRLPEEALDTPLPQNLQPGDYLRRGNFGDVGANYVTNGPTSRLFVDGDLSIQSGRRLNTGGNTANFILVVTGTLTIAADVQINGYIYADEIILAPRECTFQAGPFCFAYQPPTQITGSLTSASTINIQGSGTAQNAPVISHSAVPQNLQGGDFCLAQPRKELGLGFNDGPWRRLAPDPIEDSGEHGLTVLPVNGPGYLTNDPALPTDNMGMGSCGYATFDSSRSQHFESPDSVPLNFSGSFTIGAWIRPDSHPESGLMTILSKDENYEFHLTPDGRVNWWWQDRNGQIEQFNSDDIVPVGQWTYVAIRYTPSEQSIFINGNRTSRNQPSAGLRQNTQPLQIGADQNTPGRYFNGSIDKVSIFRGALTAQQLNELRQERSPCQTDGADLCYADDFMDQSDFEQNWAVSRSAGDFTPQIVGGRLRLTEAVTNQATRVTLNRIFPARDNRVEVEFDYYAYAGSSADGIAVVLSDASQSPQSGSFGGSLGYAQRDNGDVGFAGGWLGIGLDEFGNFSRSTEGRQGGVAGGLRPHRVVMRGAGAGTNGYAYLTDSGNPALNPRIDQPGGTPGPGHRYRIIIDSRNPTRSMVSVERSLDRSEAGFEYVIPPTNVLEFSGQSEVPENFFLSFTGSTGANTNIHELGDVEICADTFIPVSSSIHHYRLDYNSNALTCRPQEVSVRACVDANCETLYQQSASVTLTPNEAPANWQPEATATFAGSIVTRDFHYNQPGTAALGVSNPSPVAENPTLCRINGAEPSTDCNITFADSGFIFEVPDHVSNTLQSDIAVQAVYRDEENFDVTQSCSPRFQNESKTLRLWSDYLDPGPADRPVSLPISISTQEDTQEVALTESQATNVPLDFNDDGIAFIDLSYPDAGLMQLNARYQGASGTPEEGLNMRGSDTFVTRPQGLCVQVPEVVCTDINNAGCAFLRAGENFAIQISAHGAGTGDTCQAPPTPNFRMDQVNLQHQLIAPAEGVVGNLGQTGYAHSAAENALNEIENQFSEVGVIHITAQPATDYFGYTDIQPHTSDDVGRFVPAYFKISGDRVIAACESPDFSYLGQPLQIQGSIEALNTSQQRTLNYTDDFARGEPQPLVVRNGDDISGRVDALELDIPWANGIADFTQLLRLDRDAQPEAIFAADMGITVDDRDNDMTQLLNPNLLGYGHRIQSNNPAEFRYGRLVLEDINGPEDENLYIIARIEQWQETTDGGRFLRNFDDNCSVLDSSQLRVVEDNEDLQPEADENSNIQVQEGINPMNGLLWQAPQQAGEFRFLYQAEPWLEWLWDEGEPGDEKLPHAWATFGQFRGNDRIIFWMER
ncbi:hypothetical protein CWE09_08245 [Aliidiomarina minuta]|uniref:LamG-like jellyroll fold domain-containing protein n=1 Tax=Aliidiomarina minuta TaxID=880057 RepID=A0A432W948_9GAMM|nr:DUF6701 domain-containing protein [Aliidiomarina minuta]RUO26677.1 hypothetical protein CWE09_08245 [Aliidiomarina minuta]